MAAVYTDVERRQPLLAVEDRSDALSSGTTAFGAYGLSRS